MTDTDYFGPGGRMRFRSRLLTDVGLTLGEALDDWQRERVWDPLDERTEDDGYRCQRCVFELPRGHMKTGMIAAEAVTELVLGGDERQLHCFAVDLDQAHLLFDAARGYILRDPELSPGFKITGNTIENLHTLSTLTVHASDHASAWGLIIDWAAVDEMWRWIGPRHEELWVAIRSTMMKRPNYRLVVISNAGIDKDAPYWKVREDARRDSDSYFYASDGVVATWIDPAEIERLRHELPAAVFQRVIENKWTRGSASFLTEDQVSACVDSALTPQSSTDDPSPRFTLGVDLGLKRDLAVISLLETRRITDPFLPDRTEYVLVDQQVWSGTRDDPVPIAEIEQALTSYFNAFPIAKAYTDPWQMEATIQRFDGLIEPFPMSQVPRMSQALFDVVTSATLRLYEDEALVGELVGAELEQNARGWRIKFKRGRHGHGDRVMSLGYALIAALDSPDLATTGGASHARVYASTVTHATRSAGRFMPVTTDGKPTVLGGEQLVADQRGNVRRERLTPSTRSGPAPMTKVAATVEADRKANPSNPTEYGDAPWQQDGSDPSDWTSYETYNSRTGRYDRRYWRRP
jgi:Phage Terminase